MSGYHYPTFLALVKRAWPRTACWVCDRLLPVTLRPGEAMVAVQRCVDVSGGIVDAHHLLSKQLLKRERRGDGLDELLMDERNGIPVRRYHHDALENAMVKIPRGMLPPATVAFASEHGLMPLLERYYTKD